MMPRLGAKYDITIETIAKPRAEYQTDAWFELDLPVAPAVMVEDEIVVEGADVSLDAVEACICRHLEVQGPKEA
jgi:hypothetical protein